jgi:Raf kinase inhibitor-like YbhB/YbcL family protein
MTRRRSFLQHIMGWVGLTGLALVACQDQRDRLSLSQTGVKSMKLESSAFEANGLIPSQYTCDGANISPPLSWDAPPAETESLALIVDDPDAPVGIFVHWVAYDIPPETHQLPEGIAPQATLIKGGTQGKNDFGKLGYGGPCPPSGTHRYFFKLYALDRTLSLPPGATKAQLEAALNGHVLAAAELVGRYAKRK